MRGWAIAWRVLLVAAVFVVIGLATDHVLVARAVARATPQYQGRLAGAMGGLFAGGATALLVGFALLLPRRKRPDGDP